MLGYKVMRVSDDGKKLISGANSDLSFDLVCGEISMPGNGIYMSPNKEYVLTYYSGLAEKEALVTFEFNEKNIKWGNVADKESEIAINNATITDIEMIE